MVVPKRLGATGDTVTAPASNGLQDQTNQDGGRRCRVLHTHVCNAHYRGSAPDGYALDVVVRVDGIDTNDMERSALMTVAPALIWPPEPYLQIKAEYNFVLEHESSGGYSRSSTQNDKFWAAVVVEF